MSETHSAALSQLVRRLAGHSVLVVGDVILDEYLIGRASRLSREAPIPVLEFERRTYIPGGAANPAMNITALGSAAVQVGVTGADAEGETLRHILAERGVRVDGLVADGARPTITKTRIMAQIGLRFPQQVARIDRINRSAVNGEVEAAVIAAIERLAGEVNAILVSDYLSGLVTENVTAAVLQAAQRRAIPCAVDAQGQLHKYAGYDLIKCNADEVTAALRITPPVRDADFAAAAQQAAETFNLRGAMLITRGADGITLAERGLPPAHLPAPHIEDVFDTVGAGDTVIAVMTLGLAAGTSMVEAAQVANAAASVVIRRVGNYAPSADEVIAALTAP
jgi:rfaE bifunctional protein kinase chain/domain